MDGLNIFLPFSQVSRTIKEKPCLLYFMFIPYKNLEEILGGRSRNLNSSQNENENER